MLLVALGCGGRANDRERSGGSAAADVPPAASSTPGVTPSSPAAPPPRPPSENAPTTPQPNLAPGSPAASTSSANSCFSVAQMLLIRPVALGENVLAANCGACHGGQLESPAGGVGPIDDLDLLSAQGQLFFCDPERSPIVKSIRSGAMPPPASGYAAVSPLDLELILCTLALECELSPADAGVALPAATADAAPPETNTSDAAVPRADRDGTLADGG